MAKYQASIAAVAALLLLGAASPATADNQAQARCAAFAGTELRPGVSITGATYHSASAAKAPAGPGAPPIPALPAHCLVEGKIDPHTGADGKAYAIGFALALPDEWNGRFLLQGGGGLNGAVGQPIGPTAAGDRPALARGFAVIAHDSGHQGAVFDDSFMKDQRAALDFAEASVRTVTIAGKALTERFYKKPIAHSYMTGCSTGGREGMLASQRYPELFDGIIVGAPAMRAGDSNLGVEYTQVLFNAAAPKDAEGKPIMSQVLTGAQRKTLLDGILDQCDGLDGLKDGMIENVAQCHFKPERLQCAPGKTDGCLSAGQVEALQKGFAGPFDKAGFPIYAPVAFDTGIMATPIGYLPTGGPGPFGPPSTATTIDLDARIHAVRQDAAGRLTDTNYWTNLNTYLGRGGKMIFYHGVSDFWFSPLATWDYYQRATETNGAAFTDASRFYMVPGMLHCAGGNAYDQFDLLGPLVDWVERDKAPDRPIASRRDGSAAMPMCPHPSYAHYVGGDKSKPESFQCRMPEGGGA
jgi:feruloyl esterase